MRAAVGHNAFLEKPISQVIEGPAFGGRVILLSLATASVVLGLYQGLFPF
jgi:hypothetical protein